MITKLKQLETNSKNLVVANNFNNKLTDVTSMNNQFKTENRNRR